MTPGRTLSRLGAAVRGSDPVEAVRQARRLCTALGVTPGDLAAVLHMAHDEREDPQ